MSGTECVKGCSVEFVSYVSVIVFLSMREVEEVCVVSTECVKGSVSWLVSGIG